MFHSFSTESFVKPTRLRQPQLPYYISNDATLPKQFSHRNPTSEDSPQKSTISTRSISKLKKKIKQIKSALKIAEQHNQQLHLKLNQQKKYFNDQHKFMQIQVNKYKSLYEMLIDNYEGRSVELKEARKRIKKLEREEEEKGSKEMNREYESKMVREAMLREEEENRKLKEVITEQEVHLDHVKHQNNLLRDEIALKNKKISEFQILIETYQAQSTIRNTSHITQQFMELLKKLQFLQEDHKRLKKDREIAITKAKRLEVELESTKHLKQALEGDFMRLNKEHDELKLEYILLQKMNEARESEPEPKWKAMYEESVGNYNELIKFSYEIQKDFERELHTMAKELTRREMVKNQQLSES